MSAFVVSEKHIDYLVSAAYLWTRTQGINGYERDNAARMLEAENRRSVAYRYPSAAESNPVAIADALNARPPVRLTLNVNPVQVLKAIACLEYQSCEHPEWETSTARAWLESLRNQAIANLPGYETAAWEIT